MLLLGLESRRSMLNRRSTRLDRLLDLSHSLPSPAEVSLFFDIITVACSIIRTKLKSMAQASLKTHGTESDGVCSMVA